MDAPGLAQKPLRQRPDPLLHAADHATISATGPRLAGPGPLTRPGPARTTQVSRLT